MADSISEKKIVFIVAESAYFLQHRLPLANFIREKGGHVVVVTAPGPATKQIQALGFVHREAAFRRGSTNPITEARSLLALVNILRDTKPDLIHAVALKPILYAAIARQFVRRPRLVAAITGLGYSFTAKGLKPFLLRIIISVLFRLFLNSGRTRVIFENSDDQELLVKRRILNKRLTCVVPGSGVDISKFTPQPQARRSRPQILVACRLLWDKGLGECIDASRRLIDQGLEFELVFAGSPDHHNPSTIHAQDLKAWEDAGLVRLLGYQADMVAVYRDADIVCLPSYREGLPMALLEGAACGRPIITTDAPGCREIIAKHAPTNGLLVPPRDSVALASALASLLRNPQLRYEMGLASRAFIENRFSSEIVVAKTNEIYNELL